MTGHVKKKSLLYAAVLLLLWEMNVCESDTMRHAVLYIFGLVVTLGLFFSSPPPPPLPPPPPFTLQEVGYDTRESLKGEKFSICAVPLSPAASSALSPLLHLLLSHRQTFHLVAPIPTGNRCESEKNNDAHMSYRT